MKFFRDNSGRVVIGQKPNWQIIIAFLLYLLSLAYQNHQIYEHFRAGFLLFLSFWAYEEIISGVNYFRRILGSIVAIYILVQIVQL